MLFSAALNRRVWRPLALSLGLLGSSHVLADAASLLQSVHGVQLQSFLSLNAFYNYSESQDKAALGEINEAMAEVDSLTASIQTDADELKLGDKSKVVKESASRVKKLLSSNLRDIKNNGYPDTQPVADMANEVITLNEKLQELYLDVKAIDPNASSERTDKARVATSTIAKMMTKYSARTTSASSQTFQGAETEKAIDELAADFDAMLAELNKSAPSDEAKAILKGVNSKWDFVKGSFLNYNENAVPYLINLYSKKIITGLGELTDLYAGG